MTTRPPNPSTVEAMRASSVATTTSSTPGASRAASQTHWIMGRPEMGARGLPGNREAWNRDGRTARVRMGWPFVDGLIIARPRPHGPPGGRAPGP